MPTRKELAHALDLARSTTFDLLKALERKGRLQWLPKGTLHVQIVEKGYHPKPSSR